MSIHYLKMRIGFDLRPFIREETGVGVYFKKLLFALAVQDPTNEYFLFSSSFKDRFDPIKIPAFTKKRFVDLRCPVMAIDFFWHRLRWPAMDVLFKTDLDLTHSPTHYPIPTRGKKIVTVHDLFFLDHPDLAGVNNRRILFRKVGKSLKEADGIVAVSYFTERQLLEKFDLDKDKVRVIHHGIDLEQWQGDKGDCLESTRDHFSLPPEFLLFVGTHEPRKNVPHLIKALRILHDRNRKISLVLVGRAGRDSENLQRIIRELALGSWVKMLGYVDDTRLRHIYRLASVFVFPSFIEGFGIPLLEAMVSGLPIVTSRSSALPEVAQDAVLYSDPDDPEDIATKIITVLENQGLREKLIAAGKNRIRAFSWEKTASETLAFYQDIFRRN